MRPGLITATQSSGAPLPLPIRVSAGFLVIGLSGKTRIQILPPRLIKRVIAIRPASICLLLIQAGSSVFNPNSPNDKLDPRWAFPVIRPRCCFRYLTFLGINMTIYLQKAGSIFHTSQTQLSSLSISVPVVSAVSVRSAAARTWTRLRSGARSICRLLHRSNTATVTHDVSAIDPDFYADFTESRVGFGKSVIDIGSQGVQRQTTVEI